MITRTSSPNNYKWSIDKKFDTADRLLTQNDKQILPDIPEQHKLKPVKDSRDSEDRQEQ